MIIDSHAHLGTDLVFDEVREEEDIIQKMEEHKVDATLVQPMFGAVYPEDIRNIHDRIYKFSQAYPRKIFGVASMPPLIHEADYYNEAKRCVKELGFVGIKLHPAAHSTSPTSKRGEMVWKVCSELGIPLMVHTGAGVPFALPANVIGRCKQYKDVQCILAHSGMISFAGEAFLAATECPNVILETSWTAAHHIEHFIELFGADRVMFAGDEGTNIVVELAKYRSLRISSEELDWCLWKTANQVFRLGF
jgi:hypothetical protein